MKPRERCDARLKGSRSVDDRRQRSAGQEREPFRRAIVAIVIALAGHGLVAQQPPGGIPALTPAQRNALAELTATVAPLVDAGFQSFRLTTSPSARRWPIVRCAISG